MHKLSKKASSNCINVSRERDESTEYSMIVPVWVWPKNQPSKKILQYAVLDYQSNVGFISQKLYDKLLVNSPKTQLLLSTVQEQNFLIDSNRMCGIEVSLRATCIELPPMFAREKVPGNHHQIPKVSAVSKLRHLKGVAERLMPCDSGI